MTFSPLFYKLMQRWYKLYKLTNKNIKIIKIEYVPESTFQYEGAKVYFTIPGYYEFVDNFFIMWGIYKRPSYIANFDFFVMEITKLE